MWHLTNVNRGGDLQTFLDAAEAAVVRGSQEAGPRFAGRKVYSALRRRSGPIVNLDPVRVPACAHLDAALGIATSATSPVCELGKALAALSPRLAWSRRKNADPANAPFYDGHANAMIVGPGGLEERGDVWVGVTLMAPDVTYIEHDHPPEEVYVALTPGEWWNAAMDWTSPGIGGLIYNPPGIRHAMRSGAEPMLAIWCLPVA